MKIWAVDAFIDQPFAGRDRTWMSLQPELAGVLHADAPGEVGCAEVLKEVLLEFGLERGRCARLMGSV